MAMTDDQIRTCYHRIRKIETENDDLKHRTYWDTCHFIAFLGQLPPNRVFRVCIDEEYDERFGPIDGPVGVVA